MGLKPYPGATFRGGYSVRRLACGRGGWSVVGLVTVYAVGPSPAHAQLEPRAVPGRVRLSSFVALQNVFDGAYVGSVVINGANGRSYEPAPRRNTYSVGAGR